MAEIPLSKIILLALECHRPGVYTVLQSHLKPKSCTHLFVEYFEVLQALLGDEQADEPLLRAHGHLSVRAVHRRVMIVFYDIQIRRVL